MPVCPTCLAEISVNDRFCLNCGIPVSSSTELIPGDATVGPIGLGGWLILVDISIMLGTVSHIVAAVTYIAAGRLLLSLLEIGLTTYCVICLIFMINKSRYFPTMYIGMICANVGAGLAIWLSNNISQINGAYLVGRVLGGGSVIVTFTAYMFNSKRVKNTFVN